MATYEIKSPDGQTWEVNAPDSASEAEVMSYAQSQWTPTMPAGGGRGFVNPPEASDVKGNILRQAASPDATVVGKAQAAQSWVGERIKELQQINPQASLDDLAGLAGDEYKRAVAAPAAAPADRVRQYLDKGYTTDDARANAEFDTGVQNRINLRAMQRPADERGDRAIQGYNPNTESERVARESETLAGLRDDALGRIAAGEMNSVVRGAVKGGVQSAGLTAATVGYLADVVGADTVKQWGLDTNNAAQKIANQMTLAKTASQIASVDDFQGWLAENGGYVAYQAAEALLAGGLAAGLSKQAARQAAIEATTLGMNNLRQTLGSVYADAVDESKRTGKAPSLLEVAAGAAGSAAIDTFADKFGLDAITGAGFKGATLSRMAKSISLQGAVQGGTEALQLIPEEMGAGRDPFREGMGSQYFDEAAVGALGGGGPGIAGGLKAKSELSVEDALIRALETGQTVKTIVAPRVEDMPTTPVVPPVARPTGLGDILQREGLNDATNPQPAPATATPVVEPPANVVPAAPAGDAVPAAAQPAVPGTYAASVTNPTGAVPQTTSPQSNLAAEMAAIKQRAADAKAAEEAKAAADATAEQAKVASTGSNYQQKTATPVPLKGAAPNPQAITNLVNTANEVGAKHADMQNAGVYTEPVLYGIINHPNTGPELLNAARSELNRRRGIAPNVNVNSTTDLGTNPGSTGTRVVGPQGSKQTSGVQTATDGGNPVVQQQGEPGVSGSPAGTPAFSNPQAAGPVDPKAEAAYIKGLPQAASADNDTILRMQAALHRDKGVMFRPVQNAPLSAEQRLVSHLAHRMGKTLTWMAQDTGKADDMPDGFVSQMGGKHIFIDINSSKPLAEILLHEGTHALPAHIRTKLRDFVNARVTPTGREAFLKKYGYDKAEAGTKDEEVLAYVGQLITRKPEFISDLKNALGNKDFAEFARVLIDKMKSWLGKGDGELDRTFLDKHVKDVQAIHDELVKAYTQAMQEEGLQPDAAVTEPVGPVMANKPEEVKTEPQEQAAPQEPVIRKANAQEKRQAQEYEEKTGFAPYTSAGQIEIPLDQSVTPAFALKSVSKDGAYDPRFNLPLNKNGTVTLYFPTNNEHARVAAREKVLLAKPGANRVYLTNESSAPKVTNNPGNIEQEMDGANVLVQIDPNLLHLDQEHEDGRKDFFIPIAEGDAFKQKMKQVKLFTQNAPRTKALSKDTTLVDLENSISSAISAYLEMTPAEQRARAKEAKDNLKRLHNVGTLLSENGKLQKTRVGDYGLTYDGKSVASMGLGLASAQKINEKNLSSCPKSAICEGLCLGETSGQNLLYGGDGQYKSGPRLSQYLKTEAMVQSTEDFAIQLYREIDAFNKWAQKETGNETVKDDDGNKVQVPKQVYQAAIRLNVTSDFRPKVFGGIINAFPDVSFYDYTKLPTKKLAANHHLTYSSTGASQVVNGETVVNKESNWNKMVEVMRSGDNVAMAFSDKNDMPAWVVDEKTGEKFQVWDGDNYDARFLDPKPGQPGNTLNKGMIIGLTNKDRTGRPEDAAVKNHGFFLDYNKARDGDTLVIKDQDALATGRKTIPIKPTFANKPQNLDQDITLDIPVEGGKTAKLTVNAKTYLDNLNKRQEALQMVKECMA